MAVSSMLPLDCSLRPESDDEESFVVLGHSLPPESMVETKSELQELIDTSVVERSIDLTTSSLELNSCTLTSSAMPKLNEELCLIKINDNTTPKEIPSVDLSPDEIQRKVDFLVEENMKLKETLHQNNLAMKKQYETLATWQEEVLTVHASHKQKFDDIKKYVEKLKLENARLSTTLTTKLDETETVRQELDALKIEQKIAKERSEMRNSFNNIAEFQIEAAKNKITKLESSLTEKSKEHETSLAELEQLQISSQNEIADLNKKQRESEALQKILLDEVKSLKEQLSVARSAKESGKNFEEQLMAAQMHITKLELCRNEDRDTINSNEMKILELQKKIEENTAANDTMSALHAQLEIYKLDFEAEQHAKVELGVEKEKIAEDLCNLQRRNQQLLDEVERLRGSDYVHVLREEHTTAPQESPEPVEYTCPMCMIRFRSLRILEDHIEYCVFHTQ